MGEYVVAVGLISTVAEYSVGMTVSSSNVVITGIEVKVAVGRIGVMVAVGMLMGTGMVGGGKGLRDEAGLANKSEKYPTAVRLASTTSAVKVFQITLFRRFFPRLFRRSAISS